MVAHVDWFELFRYNEGKIVMDRERALVYAKTLGPRTGT